MEDVKILALGGLDEDGKNMYIIEAGDDIFVVECGLKYPDPKEQLGIEYIIPDFSYLLNNKERVKGIFITHAHDDVMKGLPHLLKEAEFDIYATALTAKILELEFRKHKIRHKIKVVSRNQTFKIGNRKITTFPVMQSIADGMGVAIETDQGLVVYTSEFIFDYDSFNANFAGDINILSEIGNKGIFALLSESVGAARSGYTAPRHKISNYIDSFFEYADNRIIVTLYKQNLYRVIEVIENAIKYNKKIFFYDNEQNNLVNVISDLGYYNVSKVNIVNKREFDNSDDDIVIIISGSGNEVFKLVHKIAVGEDKVIDFRNTDTIIIASPVVPGTEKEAAKMEDELYRASVKINKINGKEVLSMHASAEDLKMMLYMLKPKYYIPIKGDYRSLIENAKLATAVGYTANRIVVLDNGQIAHFNNQRLKSTRDVIKLEESLIDGKDKLDVGGMILKDRETLSTDGAIVLGILLDYKTREIIGGPDIQSRGVIYLKDADYIMEEISNILINTIKENIANNTYDNMSTRMEVREKINKYLFKETGKKPMILPAIIEINL